MRYLISLQALLLPRLLPAVVRRPGQLQDVEPSAWERSAQAPGPSHLSNGTRILNFSCWQINVLLIVKTTAHSWEVDFINGIVAAAAAGGGGYRARHTRKSASHLKVDCILKRPCTCIEQRTKTTQPETLRA